MTTITIRADDSLRKELEERAASSGKSLSALAVEILRGALTPQRSLEASDGNDDAWRRELRERNWRS